MNFPRQRTDKPITSTYSLPRFDGSEWVFQLSPLPLGFHRRLHQFGFLPPLPPVNIARDSQGKPMKDAAGMAIVHADERDADYRQAAELYHQRIAVLAIREALRNDSSVEFATASPPRDSADSRLWVACADDSYTELAEAGFTDGDLIQLCEEICRLSNLLDRHLTSARSNFSPALPTNTA